MNTYLLPVYDEESFPKILSVKARDLEQAKEKFLNVIQVMLEDTFIPDDWDLLEDYLIDNDIPFYFGIIKDIEEF